MERNLERQFDQRMAAREADHQRELSEMRTRMEKLSVDRGGGDDKADAAHEAAIGALKDKLAAAYERGDSQASADITLQISQLDAKYWAKKAATAGVTTRETDDEERPAARQPQQVQQQANKGPTIAGARFIRANEDWWDDPEYTAEKASANAIYVRLVEQDGFDPKSDETYREVALRLKKMFPKLNAQPGRRGADDDDDDDDDDLDDTGRERQTRQTRRQAAAANVADRGAGTNRTQTGRLRTLTPQEIKTMRDCRLDPDNDRDVVQFLREAQALEDRRHERHRDRGSRRAGHRHGRTDHPPRAEELAHCGRDQGAAAAKERQSSGDRETARRSSRQGQRRPARGRSRRRPRPGAGRSTVHEVDRGPQKNWQRAYALPSFPDPAGYSLCWIARHGAATAMT